MIIQEHDINFKNITGKDFEELCFDFLWKFGYEGLVWRQGGADNGRDIEGLFSLSNPIVGRYNEKWFFECKNYSTGVSIEDIVSKIAWADAERPDHLVFLISSYLTNDCRHWIEQIRFLKPYKIHLVEGKQLKRLLLNHEDLIIRYFADQYIRLFHEAQKNWLIHELLPDPALLNLLSKNINFDKLEANELGFLWCSCELGYEDIENWLEENEPFSFEHLWERLIKCNNSMEPILLNLNRINSDSLTCRFGGCIIAKFITESKNIPRQMLYTFTIKNNIGLEILIEATSDFPIRIRYISCNAEQEMEKAIKKIILDINKKTD